MPSRFVNEKARQLVAENRVRPMPGLVFEVEDDNGTYVVTPGAEAQQCSCYASRECSHVAAAAFYVAKLAREDYQRRTDAA